MRTRGDRRKRRPASNGAAVRDALTNAARLAALIQSLQAAVLVEDEDRRIVLVNDALCTLFQVPVPPESVVGTDCSDGADQVKGLFADPDGFVDGVERLLAERCTVTAEPLDLADGRVLERDYIAIHVDATYRGHLWVYRDVSERVDRERRLTRQALHDALTGLLNREGLSQRLAEAHPGQLRTVLFVDIDRFKPLNDEFGHSVGDHVLVEVARRLSSVVASTDSVARLGGDEFVVVCEGRGPTGLAERLLDEVAVPIRLEDGREVGVTVSIGIAEAEGRRLHQDLLRNADAAMYQAKRRGGASCQSYLPDLESKAG